MINDTSDSVSDLYDNAACGLLVTTADDVITSVNSTFLAWTGFAREDVVGRDFHAMLDSGSQVFYATRYQAELFARQQMLEVAFRLTREDGTGMPILVNARVAKAPGDGPLTVRLAVFDATVRQGYEREMLVAKRQAETSESSVRILQEASTTFLAATTETDLAEAVAEASRQAFAATDCAVVLCTSTGEFSQPDPTMPGFTVAAGRHLGETLQQLSTEGVERLMQPSGVMIIGDLDEAYLFSQRVGDVFRAARAEAMMAIPIVDGVTIIGAIVCFFGRPRQFDEQAIQLFHAIARQAALVLSRVRLQAELQQLAMHDQLTGLANRNLLRERISHAIAIADRSREPMALIFVDLDGFKLINDTLGHAVGDMVLQTIAERMNRVVRASDIVGRFGGDEFVVVCDRADDTTAGNVAIRLTEHIREPITDLPPGFSLTASVGVAVYLPGESPRHTGDSLVRIADAAMYESKRSGADRATFARA